MPTRTDHLPGDLVRRLERLRTRYRQLAVLGGTGRLLLAVVASVSLGLLVDTLWPLPVALRVMMLAAIGLAVVAAARRFLWRPLRDSIETAELAALVEHVTPELHERLISSVELNDPATPEAHKGSRFMRQLLDDETLEQTTAIRFHQALSPKRSARLLGLSAIGLLLLVGPLAFPGSGYRLLFERFLSPWSNLQRVGLYSIEVDEGDRVVARGADVRLVAQVERTGGDESPSTTWCLWTTDSGRTDRRRMEPTADGAAWTTAWPEVLEGFRFEVRAGGSRSRRYVVTVVDPPTVTAATLDIRPPAYTGLPARSTDAAVGDIPVFEQSELVLQLVFNKPLAAAELRWQDPGVDGDEASPLVLADDGTSARLTWTAIRGGPFGLVLTDRKGLTNADDPYRNLVLQLDQPPTLSVTGQAGTRAARPSDVVTIRTHAADDFGLGALELHCQLDPDHQHLLTVDAARLGGREIVHHFELDLAALGVTDGDTLTWRIRAADQRPVPGPNEIWSDPRTLRVDSAAGPPSTADVLERQRQLREELETIRQQVAAGGKRVARLNRQALDDLDNQRPFEQDEPIRQAAAAQRDLALRLNRLAARFDRHPLFANMVPSAQQIARDKLAAAAGRLQQAAPAPLADKAARLEQAGTDLADAEQQLEALARQFDELAELERDLLELNRLARQAGRLADDAGELAALGADAPPRETDSERAERRAEFDRRRQELAERRNELGRELDDLLERRPEIVDAARRDQLDQLAELSRRALEIAEPQDLLAEALAAEARANAEALVDDVAEQERLLAESQALANRTAPQAAEAGAVPLDPDRVREALEQLRAGNPQAAAEAGREAAEDLKRLAAALEANRHLPADPQQALEQLARRQRELARKLAEASPAGDNVPELGRNRRRELAAEQAGIQAGLAGRPLPAEHRQAQAATVRRAADNVDQLLGNRPRDAATAAEQLAGQVEDLAQAVGSEQQRRQQARETVARLRREQDALARDFRLAADPNRPPTPEALERGAARQAAVARQLADLDAPGAAADQRQAVRRSVRARLDLEQPRPANVPGSQAQAQQALAQLDRRLAGEPSPQEDTARLARRQQEIQRTAEPALKADDADARTRAAKQQRQLADQLERLDLPAAATEQRAAARAARQAAEALGPGTPPEQARTATARARQAVDQLAAATRRSDRPATDPAAERAADSLRPAEPVSPAELARQAAELADAQSGLRQQSEPEAGRPATPERLQQLAGEQQQLAEQVERLPAGETPLPAARARAATRQAARALEQQDPAAAVAAQRQAEQALADVQRQARALANPAAEGRPNAEAAAAQARQLAERQQALARQIDPAGSEAAATSDTPGDGPANPAATPAERQTQLARDATRLAIDIAAETGTGSAAAGHAAAMARQAAQAARQAQGGQPGQAQQSADQARQAGQNAASDLAVAQPQPNPMLERRANQLTQQQEQLAGEFARQNESASGRRTSQQQGQQSLAAATSQLTRELDGTAERLAAEPLELDRQAGQAARAGQSTDRGRRQMQQSGNQLGQQNPGEASASARQAAASLRDAARTAEGATAERPETPVPNEVGARVAEASEQLAQAGQEIDNANFNDAANQSAPPGQQGQGQSGQKGQEGQSSQKGQGQSGQKGQGQGGQKGQGQSGQKGQGQSGQKGQGQSGQKGQGQSGQKGQGQSGQPGKSGQGNASGGSSIQRSANRLRQAANALAQASQQMQPGRGQGQGQSRGQSASQDGSGSSKQPQGDSGSGASLSAELARLESQLQQLSGQNWGQLPGHLRTEILQASRRNPNGDYARLIRFYFKEIAAGPAADTAASPDGR